MTFVCIICQRTQPIWLGRSLPSGSWVCVDTDDCVDHMKEER